MIEILFYGLKRFITSPLCPYKFIYKKKGEKIGGILLSMMCTQKKKIVDSQIDSH